MEETKELTNNGWQNIGIMYMHMRDSGVKLTGKQSDVYMDIVRYSVGFGQPFINQMSQTRMAKLFGMSNKTLNSAIKLLEDANLLKRVEDTSYIENGGSKPQRVGPIYPKKFHLWMKDNNKDTTEIEPVKENIIKDDELMAKKMLNI